MAHDQDKGSRSARGTASGHAVSGEFADHGRPSRCPRADHLAGELAEELVWGQVSFMLQSGDYLIVNQRRFLHGREALHSGQEAVPVADRRLLLQMFLRAPAGVGSAA
ncbi:hypothetical protein [Nonomuraea sp. NPDC049695]|uniref:hypothetical protein n=1 Tax=Nonomuraea sp. NPDC049695 TaxID=3154734 RepID=UPI0034155C0D